MYGWAHKFEDDCSSSEDYEPEIRSRKSRATPYPRECDIEEEHGSDTSSHDTADDLDRKHEAPVDLPNVVTATVDALELIKRGSPFLKFGRKGEPHWRQVRLSDDKCSIVWFSARSRPDRTTIDLARISDVRLGQDSRVFRRYKGSPDAAGLASLSFSIMYDANTRSLDLMAKDPNIYSIWTVVLLQLAEMNHKGEVFMHVVLRQLRALPLSLQFVQGHRSCGELRDIYSNKTVEELEPAVKDPKLLMLNIVVHPLRARRASDEQLRCAVSKSLSRLEIAWQCSTYEARGVGYLLSEHYHSLASLLAGVYRSVLKVKALLADALFDACDDEIWRAEQDLEAAQDMLRFTFFTCAKVDGDFVTPSRPNPARKSLLIQVHIAAGLQHHRLQPVHKAYFDGTESHSTGRRLESDNLYCIYHIGSGDGSQDL
eukprot:g25612.t1